MKVWHFVVGAAALLILASALLNPSSPPTVAQNAGESGGAEGDKARQAAKEELAAATAGLEEYRYPYPADWAVTPHVSKPEWARKKIAAYARWEKAELAANGPNWRNQFIADAREKRIREAKAETDATREAVSRMNVGDLLRAGLPITQSEVKDAAPDTSPIIIPSSTDMDPFVKAMNVRYDASDDKNFDEDAIYGKLKNATEIANAAGYGGKALSVYSEYLRCEVSYDIHGGYVTKRPVAKPCEHFLDAIIATALQSGNERASATSEPPPSSEGTPVLDSK